MFPAVRVRDGSVQAGVSSVRHTSKTRSPASWRRAAQSHDRLSVPGRGAVAASISTGFCEELLAARTAVFV